MLIPEWKECTDAVDAGTATPLQRFVYYNEPAGKSDEWWRGLLQNVIDDVEQAAQHAAYEQARIDAVKAYFDAPEEVDPDNAIRYMPNPYTVFPLASQPAAETGREPERYCPDCETKTSGRSGPEHYGLHHCPKCETILFDPQLDEWPGETHGKPKPDVIDDAMGNAG